MTSLEIIPQHEPEIIAAVSRKRGYADDEKVATTSIDLLVVHGVEITSRYQKADEFELMREMILALPLQRGAVDSIFCDSKAGRSFYVVLRYWNEGLARAIGDHLEGAAMACGGGHNGITIVSGEASGRSRLAVHFGARWSDLE